MPPLARAGLSAEGMHAGARLASAGCGDAPEEAGAIARRAHELGGSSLLLGRLALYSGQLGEAHTHLTRCEPSVARNSALAALALLLGEPSRARAMLTDMAHGPSDTLLLAEALRREGEVTEAARVFTALSSDSLMQVAAAPLCRIAILAPSGPREDEDAELLAALRSDFPDLASIENPADFAGAALDSLSGNWTRRATRPGALGQPRPQAIARPIRERVAGLRRGLSLWPIDAAVTQCAELEAEHGPHPLIANYGAELLLWAGDYERARAWLDRAFSMAPRSRWAFIGKATVENLTGSPEQALATIALQRALMPPLPNSASCTAEACLLLGDAERALVDFETASAAHPTRVSAWLGLGQAQHLLGASPRPALDRVRQLVPVFFQQWQQEAIGLGEQERFAHAFRMLRGNRGSGLITWWTADGAFHGEQAVLSAR